MTANQDKSGPPHRANGVRREALEAEEKAARRCHVSALLRRVLPSPPELGEPLEVDGCRSALGEEAAEAARGGRQPGREQGAKRKLWPSAAAGWRSRS